MALKFEIDTLEGLDESVKKEYVKQADGKFRLDVGGLPAQTDDVAGLKKKVDELLNEKKEAQRIASEAAATAEAAKLEALKKGGDKEALIASYEEKIKKINADTEQKNNRLQEMINKLTVDSKARELAVELAAESSDVLLPHIRSRLTVDLMDGNAIVRVLDDQGKPSALSLNDLKEEFRNKPSFAPVIKASKASGGGSAKGSHGGSGGTIYRSEMTPEDKRKYQQEHGQEEYLKLPLARPK